MRPSINSRLKINEESEVAQWGDVLQEGDRGAAVIELQMRLAGFRGTIPDGNFGPGTKMQVVRFQSDVMGMAQPTGVFNAGTLAALDQFAVANPVDFQRLRCPCGQCGGFGRAINRGVYYRGTVDEAYHRYEYPGVHRMLLWAYRAAQHYARRQAWILRFNSGYRCSIDNAAHGRTTTNHFGKAIDIGFQDNLTADQRKMRANALRGMLVHDAHAQVGWAARNRKALEPANIAPTWVHYDVRTYAPAYLDDRYFVKSLAELDAPPA